MIYLRTFKVSLLLFKRGNDIFGCSELEAYLYKIVRT
jgi:hypothetical protein